MQNIASKRLSDYAGGINYNTLNSGKNQNQFTNRTHVRNNSTFQRKLAEAQDRRRSTRSQAKTENVSNDGEMQNKNRFEAGSNRSSVRQQILQEYESVNQIGSRKRTAYKINLKNSNGKPQSKPPITPIKAFINFDQNSQLANEIENEKVTVTQEAKLQNFDSVVEPMSTNSKSSMGDQEPITIYSNVSVRSLPTDFQNFNGTVILIDPSNILGNSPGKKNCNCGEKLNWQNQLKVKTLSDIDSDKLETLQAKLRSIKNLHVETGINIPKLQIQNRIPYSASYSTSLDSTNKFQIKFEKLVQKNPLGKPSRRSSMFKNLITQTEDDEEEDKSAKMLEKELTKIFEGSSVEYGAQAIQNVAILDSAEPRKSLLRDDFEIVSGKNLDDQKNIMFDQMSSQEKSMELDSNSIMQAEMNDIKSKLKFNTTMKSKLDQKAFAY